MFLHTLWKSINFCCLLIQKLEVYSSCSGNRVSFYPFAHFQPVTKLLSTGGMHQRAPRDAVNLMKLRLHLLKTCCVSLEIRQVISLPPEVGTMSTT